MLKHTYTDTNFKGLTHRMDERKNRYLKKNTDTTERIPFSLDLKALNLVCSFVISENLNIKKSHLLQLRKLVNQIDVERSFSDQDRVLRMTFIRRGLEARLDYGYSDQYIILKHINGGLIDKPLFPLDCLRELNNSEVNWINRMVAESLKTSYMENQATNLYDVLTEFKSSNQFEKPKLLPKIENCLLELQQKLRSARVQDSKEDFFSLKPDVFVEKMRETYEALKSPSNKLVSGMQGLNEMLGGGFERGRLYLFLGLPGEGKSSLMLNLAYQVKKYNRKAILKDKTKTPCIVFLTMENGMKETIERLFNITTKPESLIDYSFDEVINMMVHEGQMYVDQDNPIDIIIKYAPPDIKDTNFLYELYDELEDNGYECILMVQDYLKRIKSANNHNTELRLELGYICNEFKTFAVEKDIPFISASQLNRDAARHIDETRKKAGSDLVRLFGRNNIGESITILENTDAMFFLAPEYDKDGLKYLGIQLAKKRYRGSTRSHMYQPYTPGNEIRLVEDEGLPQPLCKNTLNPNTERAEAFANGNIGKTFNTNPISTVSMGNVNLLRSNSIYAEDDDQDNFFSVNYKPTLRKIYYFTK